MGEGTVRHYCGMFKDRRTSVHDEKRSGRQTICREWRMAFFRIVVQTSEFHNPRVNFQTIRALFPVTSELGYHEFWSRSIPKMLRCGLENQRMASALTLYSDITTAVTNFCHISRVTGDQSWVPIVTLETKEKSEQWMHTHSPNDTKVTSVENTIKC
jgi:hypothetical protein